MLEEAVRTTLARLQPGTADPLRHLHHAELHCHKLVLVMPGSGSALEENLRGDEQITRDPDDRGFWRVTVPVALVAVGSRTGITTGAPHSTRPDPNLISALRRAHAMLDRDRHGPIITVAPPTQYARRLAGLAFLAPDIQRGILAGHQPPQLTLAALMAEELPLDWAAQRKVLGFPDIANAVP